MSIVNLLRAQISRRRNEAFIRYDQSSSPSADEYIIDADGTTLRLSTGYPVGYCLG